NHRPHDPAPLRAGTQPRGTLRVTENVTEQTTHGLARRTGQDGCGLTQQRQQVAPQTSGIGRVLVVGQQPGDGVHHQLDTAGPPPVQRGLARPGALGHGLHAQSRVPVLGEFGHNRAEDRLVKSLTATAGPPTVVHLTGRNGLHAGHPTNRRPRQGPRWRFRHRPSPPPRTPPPVDRVADPSHTCFLNNRKPGPVTAARPPRPDTPTPPSTPPYAPR